MSLPQSVKAGVLLMNLGSPRSPRVGDVRNYLREFLMDPRVIDLPLPLRWPLVQGAILPFRPKESAHAYQSVWTAQGAPLLVISRQLQKRLAEAVSVPIYLAMRYAQPSISEVVGQMRADGINQVYLMPLYPQYAMSSYETVVVAAQQILADQLPQARVECLQPFYDHPAYIQALVHSALPYLEEPYDHLLFSFHGLPERHLRKSDPSHAHCLQVRDCCRCTSPAHATCYRHQCYQTVAAFVRQAGIPEDRYAVSFQSRLGRDPWLKPYTDVLLQSFPQQGIKRLRVICPAFVSDCLETLEEIAVRGKEDFLKAGGADYVAIPCLNEHPDWIAFLADRINAWRAGLGDEPRQTLISGGAPADCL